MNVLFLSLIDFNTFSDRNIYSDLLREFIKNRHRVYCISPVEKKTGKETSLIAEGENQILKLRIGNTQKVNLIEKGISTILIEPEFIKGIKTYFSGVKFDIVLYSTPPITFAKVIKYVKERDGAKTYLLLKDIFPQNAVDLGMLSKDGIKGVLYRYFKKKEKQLYELSDTIGCMSQANCDYILKHNPEVKKRQVEVCPNCVEPQNMKISERKAVVIKQKYGIPLERKVFVYGGNLGIPQGIPFLIECLKSQKNNTNVFFLIIGSGTEYGKLDAFIKEEKPENVKLMRERPKTEYDCIVGSCDVGLIFLDHRFTIPNFPSRLLSYMQAQIPVLAVTDLSTDIGKVIVEGGFGWWCESNSVRDFENMVAEVCRADKNAMGDKGWVYLQENYTVEKGYRIIMKHLEEV